MIRWHLWLGGAAVLAASPALADHMGPTGVGSGGGGLSVIGADVLEHGSGGAGLRLSYTRPDRRSDAELAALAEQGVEAHNTDYNLVAAAGLAYGVSDRLTLSLELPYVRRDRLREGTEEGAEDLGTIAGLGDATLLAKYKLTGAPGEGLALIGGLKVPTGGTHRRHDGERLETEHQPGTGSWDPVFGAAASTHLGELRLDASALYQLSGKGAQDTRLGDRLTGGIALSHRFGPPEHHHDEGEEHEHAEGEHHHEHAEHGHASWDAFVELTGEWEGRQKVGGEIEEASGGKSVWLSPGARFNTSGGWSFAGAVGAPLWQRIRDSHPDNDYRLSLAVAKGF